MIKILSKLETAGVKVDDAYLKSFQRNLGKVDKN